MFPDNTLIDDFEAGRIDGAEFHESHVEVAWGLARRWGHDDGMCRLIVRIRGIAAAPAGRRSTTTRSPAPGSS